MVIDFFYVHDTFDNNITFYYGLIKGKLLFFDYKFLFFKIYTPFLVIVSQLG